MQIKQPNYLSGTSLGVSELSLAAGAAILAFQATQDGQNTFNSAGIYALLIGVGLIDESASRGVVLHNITTSLVDNTGRGYYASGGKRGEKVLTEKGRQHLFGNAELYAAYIALYLHLLAHSKQFKSLLTTDMTYAALRRTALKLIGEHYMQLDKQPHFTAIFSALKHTPPTQQHEE